MRTIRLAMSLLCFTVGVSGPSLDTPGGDFTVAKPGYRFAFPRDHGSHPDFRTEWWYVTGHLWSPEGRRFGFQLTFFRQGTHRGPWKGSPAWRTDQMLLAHGAITDVEGARFLAGERFGRAGLLAEATEGNLSIFHGPWSLQQANDGTVMARFSAQGANLEIAMKPSTPPVIFGEQGVSRKGEDPTAASHYITFPSMAAQGTLRLPEGRTLKVSGQAWMDHEFSSNQLSQGQVGWDWAGIQLRSGHRLMAYRLRREDGTQDPWSTLTEMDAQGVLLRTTRDFEWSAAGTWISPASGARYPQPVVIKAWNQAWRLAPLLPNQELLTPRSTGITYWEGACRVLDENGQDVGDAYLEQTGYAHTLKGRF